MASHLLRTSSGILQHHLSVEVSLSLIHYNPLLLGEVHSHIIRGHRVLNHTHASLSNMSPTLIVDEDMRPNSCLSTSAVCFRDWRSMRPLCPQSQSISYGHMTLVTLLTTKTVLSIPLKCILSIPHTLGKQGSMHSLGLGDTN